MCHEQSKIRGAVCHWMAILFCAITLLAIPLGLFLFYVSREAAFPQPRGTDGQIVAPVSDQIIPDGGLVIPRVRSKRQPNMSIKSLESNDDGDIAIQNWDAALTLARLSSEVYGDNRIRFAKESLGFDHAVAIDRGDRHSLVCSNPNIVVVAFRGTKTASDMLLDVGVVPIRIGLEGDGCEVHSGFHLACDALYAEVLREIDRQDGRKKQLIVTGHSLGGAMAVVFAYLAKTKDGIAVKSVVTFGQPLLANANFARDLVYLFRGNHKRFVHRDDLVSRVARPYFHSGARILLVEGQRPLFWKAEVLTQAGPNAVHNAQPSLTVDPDVVPLSEDEMEQVRDHVRPNGTPDADTKRPRRRVRTPKRQRTNEIGAMERPNGQVAALGLVDWISHGIDDHSMALYIKCIEEQEIESDE